MFATAAQAARTAPGSGQMAGNLFQKLANSGYALPLALTGGSVLAGNIHGRIAGHSNPGHSGLPGALGYGALVNPLAGIGYYAGQRSASGNRNQEALESLESLQNYLSAINPNMLQVPGNI